MKDKLPPPVTLTAKQARFVECIARGMLSKDAYRVAYNSDVDDKQAGVRAAEVKLSKSVAIALQEVLRSRRIQDIDSIGELIADTKEDRLSAKESGAHAAVAAFDRMRGNWLGVEKTTIQIDPVQMLSDEELIHRLAGDDPKRIEAARTLLGAPEGFETEYEEVREHRNGAAVEGAVGAPCVGLKTFLSTSCRRIPPYPYPHRYPFPFAWH